MTDEFVRINFSTLSVSEEPISGVEGEVGWHLGHPVLSTGIHSQLQVEQVGHSDLAIGGHWQSQMGSIVPV